MWHHMAGLLSLPLALQHGDLDSGHQHIIMTMKLIVGALEDSGTRMMGGAGSVGTHGMLRYHEMGSWEESLAVE